MGYQQIMVMGNLARDVEVRQVGQSQVAKTAVAVSEKFRKADGTFGESTEFFELEIWDKPGVYPFLKKGTQVLAVGQIKTDKWQDQNGQNREAKKIRVQNLQLCGSRPQAQQGAPAPAPAPAQGYAPRPQAPAPQYQPATPPAPQYQAQAPAPRPQPQYQVPPQPGQPGNQQYPPMNSPAYTQEQPDDIPF